MISFYRGGKISKVNKPKKSEDGDLRVFIMAAMNMSWQLAFAVLIPVVGGYKLDQKFHSVPLLTLLGLVISTICVAIVLQRQLDMLGPNKNGGKS